MEQSTMIIVRIYTLVLFVFSAIMNSNCEMLHSSQEKHLPHFSSRSSRQFRPVLGGIVLLLTANLIAKGVLGLNAFNNYIPNNNVQGSLFVQFGQKPPPIVPYNPNPIYWRPTYETTTQTPQGQPVHQQQIINILESPPLEDYSDTTGEGSPTIQAMTNQKRLLEHSFPNPEPQFHPRFENQILQPKFKRQLSKCTVLKMKKSTKENIRDKAYFQTRFGDGRGITDVLCLSLEQQEAIQKFLNIRMEIKRTVEDSKESREAATIIEQGTTENVIPEDEVEYIDGVTSLPELTTLERQMQTTTPATTTSTTATTTSTTTSSTTTASTTTASTTTSSTIPPPTTTTIMTTTIENSNTTNNSSGIYQNETGYGYGPYTGNENISLTTMFPENMTSTTMPTNTTGNETTNATTTSSPGYNYYPPGEYGPSNGNEGISITYGTPGYFDHYRPFHGSPIDHFLNDQYGPQVHYGYPQTGHQDHGHQNGFHDHGHGHRPQHPDDFQSEVHQNRPNERNEEQFGNHFEPSSPGFGYNQFHDTSKYADLVNKFYNKYDYHYPSGNNNYFKKK